MHKPFDEVNKKLGFGCMRLPMDGERADDEQFCRMIDLFMTKGFNYFDTAHGYLGGESERAIKRCLTSRYPRESYLLTDKLTADYFEREEDIRPFFESQLEICGVEYFDFYLMHALNANNYKKFQQCRAFEAAQRLKEEGKIRHVGFSFHDTAEVLDRILTDHPEVEAVQIQLNYADFDDPGVQSRLCYEVCRRHNKPVIVMEPVKGGSLINLPQEALDILNRRGATAAEFAIRYAAGFDGIFMVLSGMSNMEQISENIGFMQDFQPLDGEEQADIAKICAVFKGQDMVPCTACRYCVDGCPKHIPIPSLFSCLNSIKQHKDWSSRWYYKVYTENGGKASDCIGCGRCEQACPQHLEIRKLLREVAETFETGEDID